MKVLRGSPWWWLGMALPLLLVFSGCATKQAVSEKPSLAAEKGMAEVGRPSPTAEAPKAIPKLEAEKQTMRPGVQEERARPGVVEEVIKPRPGEEPAGREARHPEAIILARPAPKAAASAEEAVSPFKDINFDFDKYNLRLDAKWVLNDLSKWLESNPQAQVLIEGHADERGTDEYNLALGERRAASARYYLMSMGVKADRLSTISYGEFRPIDTGYTEAAFAKNRRDHFVVKD